jgi:hypothetical protein
MGMGIAGRLWPAAAALLLGLIGAEADAQDAFTIAPSGRVGVGIADPSARLDIRDAARTGTHPGAIGLYVTGTFPAGRPTAEARPGVEFRHDNGTQGIGFGFNTIYATGSLATQNLYLQAMPSGRVVVQGAGLTVDGSLENAGLEARLAALEAAVRTLVPVGSVVAYAGDIGGENGARLRAAGWLPADGRALRRDAFTELFAAIGTANGAPDAGQFNLPDLRGRFVRGVGAGTANDPDGDRRVAAAAGGNPGNTVGSYQPDAFASHTHTQWSLQEVGGWASGSYWGQRESQTGPAGGNETRPRNIALHWLIKASSTPLPAQ